MSQYKKAIDRGEWRAPENLVACLDRVFDFSEGSNHFYLEPPRKQISEALEAAYNQAKEQGSIVVCFLPAFSDAEWWHKWVMLANEIIYIKGRVPLVDASGTPGASPVAPSCVVVFTPETVNYPRVRAMKKESGIYFLPRIP